MGGAQLKKLITERDKKLTDTENEKKRRQKISQAAGVIVLHWKVVSPLSIF